jgi:uncharacterized peroxidase-related enzyme
MTRLDPLSADFHAAELKPAFDQYVRTLGFVPNSVLIMQRRPKMVKALAQLAAAVWDPESSVNVGFKRLLAHVASRATGCQYCMAHTAGAALTLGVDAAKLEAVWNYASSPLYSPAERVALDYSLAAAAVPNAVDDALFAQLKEHWSDDEIVEITGVIALFGFMNRWNDSLATPLEPEPVEVGNAHLAVHGWHQGKHV